MTFSIYNVINLKSSVTLFVIFIIIGYCDKYINYHEPHMKGQSTMSMKPVVQQYRRFVDQNQDLGSSFAIYNNSNPLVDLVSGYEDLEFKQKWNKNTISQLFSLSNIIGALSIAHLVDRGILSYEDKLSKHIHDCHPHIGDKTLAEIMMHKADNPYLRTPVSVTEYRDNPDALLKLLLSQDLPKGDAPIFHKHTQSLILDAIVRKVDPNHRSLPHYFVEEIAYKHKIDIFVGLPRTQLYRTARVYQSTWRHFLYALGRLDFGWVSRSMFQSTDLTQKVESTFTDLTGPVTREADLLEIELPSWNVFSNADSIAMMFSILLFGSADTKPVFKPSTVSLLCHYGHEGYDDVFGSHISFTKGGLMSFNGPRKSKLCGWRDPSGQFLLGDLERNLTISYVTNHLRAISMDKDYILSYIINSLYDTL